MQFYTDPSRESDAHSLPNAEAFEACRGTNRGNYPADGWYWQPLLFGPVPKGAPRGPFDSEALAIADAQGGGPWSTSSGALTRQLRKDLDHARKQGGAA